MLVPVDDAVIVSAVRTPVGRAGGSLAAFPAWDLATIAAKEAIARAAVDPALIDDVIVGETVGGGGNAGRYVGLAAGVPREVPGCTVVRACATGLEAILHAATQIWAGVGEVFLAGGCESMSQMPWLQRKPQRPFSQKPPEYFMPPTHPEDMGPFSVGLNTGENLAEKYGVSRQEQDAWAYRSHMRAITAIDNGYFERETVPVAGVTTDEHPRRDTTLQKLAALKPVYKAGGTVTAGNASGRNDAAAMTIVMAGSKAAQLGLTPRARVVSWATVGVDPNVTGEGPIFAVPKALKRAGLTLDDIDLVEINEAFAAQTVACVRELGLDEERTNVNGGGISLGHPVGATGARLVVSLVHELERRGARRGVVTMCAGGGLGSAAVIERL